MPVIVAVLLKISALVATSMAGKSPDTSFKISTVGARMIDYKMPPTVATMSRFEPAHIRVQNVIQHVL